MSKEILKLQDLIDHIFTQPKIQIKDNVVFGTGFIKDIQFNILGTIENTQFGVDEAIEMAKHVLGIVQSNHQAPIILLTNVIGQKLSVRDEWLGMYAYYGHLLKCLHLARKKGHPIISMIYNQAIGGSFIAFGLMADRIFALKDTQLAVMWLEGMAKVTKIDIEVLRRISETSPVFAPGVENFKKLGGIHEVITLEQAPQQILAALQEKNLQQDNRAELGKKYGGRQVAYDLIQQIEKQ